MELNADRRQIEELHKQARKKFQIDRVVVKGIEAIKRIIMDIDTSNRKPKNLQTDDGREFFKNKFQYLWQSINHYSTYSSLISSIVERFNRTLKAMMWKEFSFQGTYKWINIY